MCIYIYVCVYVYIYIYIIYIKFTQVQRKMDIGRSVDELEGCLVVFVFGKWNTSDFMLLNRNYVVCGFSSLFQEHIRIVGIIFLGY